MFCRRNQWEGKNFPRELFHQTRSKRGGVLMHSKVRRDGLVDVGLSGMMITDGPRDVSRQAERVWAEAADTDG